MLAHRHRKSIQRIGGTGLQCLPHGAQRWRKGVQQGHQMVQPAGETALRGHKREELKGFAPLEGFAHIACELLAGEDGDREAFTVCDFGLWVVAMVEYVEQVVGDAEGCDDFVQRG
jgi:hypothetical protein